MYFKDDDEKENDIKEEPSFEDKEDTVPVSINKEKKPNALNEILALNNDI